jgi:hypothetical protein
MAGSPIPLSFPCCILSLTESIWSRLNHVSGLGYLILTVTGGMAQSVTTLSPLAKQSIWVAVDWPKLDDEECHEIEGRCGMV